MNRKIVTHLIIPLVAIAVVSIGINLLWPAQGFFINFATELIGIVITVGYVDWLIRRHDESIWEGAKSRIDNRLRKLGFKNITYMRRILGSEFEFLDVEDIQSVPVEEMEIRALRSALEIFIPEIPEKVRALDTDGLQKLNDHLQNCWDDTDRLLDRFGHRVSAETMEKLLDMQQTIEGGLSIWQLYGRFAKTPAGFDVNSDTEDYIYHRTGEYLIALVTQSATIWK